MNRSNLVTIRTIEPAFTDERGAIFDILEKPVGHVGFITFTAGAVRARHYHIQSTQYTYVLKGEIELIVADKKGKNVEKHLLSKGTYTEIPPEVIHIYKAVVDSEILDMTTMSRDDEGYEQDTVRVEIDLD